MRFQLCSNLKDVLSSDSGAQMINAISPSAAGPESGLSPRLRNEKIKDIGYIYPII